MAEVDITGETLDSLSGKLTEFSEGLPVEEQVTLQAMLVLAGQKLEEDGGDSEVEGFAFRSSMTTRFGSISTFRRGFASSFGTFTGYTPAVSGGSMAPVTTCVE